MPRTVATTMVSDPRESVGDAMVATDLDGTIQFCNDAMQRVFGYSAAELIGTSIALLVLPDQREEQQRMFDRIRTGDRINSLQTQLLRKDGKPIDASLTLSPFRD